MDVIIKSLEWAHSERIEIETGRLARQADGSVVLRIGDTLMLATVVARKEINPLVDFLPLSVDYKENYSSTGKIPGGFFKRDGKLNEHEILTSRVIDRSIRPLFPEDYHADIQLIVSLISSDKETQPDALACLAASAALCVSDIPFPDPVSTVRVVRRNGAFLINPPFSAMTEIDLDLIVAGTNDSIVMVEGEMEEVSEDVMMEALIMAHQAIKELNGLQLELRASVNKTPREYPRTELDQDLYNSVKELIWERLQAVVRLSQAKQDRKQSFKELETEAIETLAPETLDAKERDEKVRKISSYVDMLEYDAMRQMILTDNRRLDGRRPDEIRPIWCQVSYLPRAHGSALFTRGETQSLTTVTLGSKLDEQTIDYATVQGSKKFMLQYNFPPYSTGEVKPLRGPGRREVGHGNLAERALKVMIPSDNEYTLRVVSEILESNGSSSMATVCAGTLALMDAGVHIRRPVSGIAMGLIIEDGKWAVLSDILGDEDHLGDMDFKVTGTERGLTACQMDIKVRGLSYEIIGKALQQAKEGRAHILGKMLETLAEPREEISPYAPRIIRFSIPAEFIGAVIGPGGKVIQEIQRTTGTTINIEEIEKMGEISIAGANKEQLEAAANWVKGIAAVPNVGEIYSGKVKNIREAGAFVEFLPNKDGWLHISEISYDRIERIEDVLSVGDIIEVKYLGPDPKTNKPRLSMKALLPPPENRNGGGRTGGNSGNGGGNAGGGNNRTFNNRQPPRKNR